MHFAKLVVLAVATTVHDVLRQPSENPIPCSEAEATRLFENGLLEEEPTDFRTDADQDDEGEEADGLEDLSVPDLHLLVTKEGVALHGVTKKAEIIDAIRKHRTEKSES